MTVRFALVFFALQASYYGMRYLLWGHEEMPLPFDDQYADYRTLVVVHGFAGMTALLGGLGQLVPGRHHRWLGRVYLAAVLVAALTAFPMAARSVGGWVAKAAFFTQAGAWLATAVLALQCVRQRRFAAHRRWMVRNYALTYGAVILRLLLNASDAAGLPFDTAYPLIAWAGWVSCWLVAEIYLGGWPSLSSSSRTRRRA